MTTDPPDDLDTAVAVFLLHRPRLHAIAYRILRSTDEADDVLQDAWLRWQRSRREGVEDPAAFLATTTRRLALNVLASARVRHEIPAADWSDRALSVRTSAEDGPEAAAERAEAVGMALQLVLERLTPPQRAALLLRAGFAYPYEQIGEVLRVSAVNARQVVSRAHGHLHSARRHRVDTAAHRRLVAAFVAAAQVGELGALEALLSADAA